MFRRQHFGCDRYLDDRVEVVVEDGSAAEGLPNRQVRLQPGINLERPNTDLNVRPTPALPNLTPTWGVNRTSHTR